MKESPTSNSTQNLYCFDLGQNIETPLSIQLSSQTESSFESTSTEQSTQSNWPKNLIQAPNRPYSRSRPPHIRMQTISVYGIDKQRFNCERLFNLFSAYGCVTKVIWLRHIYSIYHQLLFTSNLNHQRQHLLYPNEKHWRGKRCMSLFEYTSYL
jgi:hypothetical protein